MAAVLWYESSQVEPTLLMNHVLCTLYLYIGSCRSSLLLVAKLSASWVIINLIVMTGLLTWVNLAVKHYLPVVNSLATRILWASLLYKKSWENFRCPCCLRVSRVLSMHGLSVLFFESSKRLPIEDLTSWDCSKPHIPWLYSPKFVWAPS